MESEKPMIDLGNLDGPDGNVFAILGKANRVARRAKWSKEKIEKFMNEAMSSDYNHALATVENYFDVV
jgi:hypothetical protein